MGSRPDKGADADSTKTGASDDMSMETLGLAVEAAAVVGVPAVLRLRGIAFASSGDVSLGTVPPIESISVGDEAAAAKAQRAKPGSDADAHTKHAHEASSSATNAAPLPRKSSASDTWMGEPKSRSPPKKKMLRLA